MAEIVKFEHMAANDEQYLTNAKIEKLLNQLELSTSPGPEGRNYGGSQGTD